MKKIISVSLAFLACGLALAEQIPSTYMILKGLAPVGTKNVSVSWSEGKTSQSLPAKLSGRAWSLEVKKDNMLQNNVANIYKPIFEKQNGQKINGPKRIINVVADEIKIGNTSYFYDISSKNSQGKLLFADSSAGGYFTKSCLNGFSTFWQDGQISGKTDACLLIDQDSNIVKIEKTGGFDPSLFEGDFGSSPTRCNQFGQVLNEKGEKTGFPICLKSSGETSISYQDGYIISTIKDKDYTYNFIYSKNGKFLAKTKFNKYQTTIETNNQLYKVFMFLNSGNQTKFLSTDDEYKFWNGIYYSPYTFLYEKIGGKWVLKKGGTFGLVEDKLYTSVDPKFGTIRGLQTSINSGNITIKDDFFAQNFNFNDGLTSIGNVERNNCGDMKNNIKIFRFNQNNINELFSQRNSVDDQYIIQGNFGYDGNVLVYPNQNLEANQPKTQAKGYFRYYISKTIGNLKSGTNNYDLVLTSKDGNQKLCKTSISLIAQ